MFDLIGDIHGHADELIGLLERLGYTQAHGVYSHHESRAIFLGDFVDRGPAILEVLTIVRTMIEDGDALAVMGNHDWNALTYHTKDRRSKRQYLRSHTGKHRDQHAQTIKQFKQLTPSELQDWLEWFRRLPLWLDLDGLRVVHACWNGDAIARIEKARGTQDCLSDDWMQLAHEDAGLHKALDLLLQGRELPLPGGLSFKDGEGHVRCEIRTRWYLPAQGQTYRSYALSVDEKSIPDSPLPESEIAKEAPYAAAEKPVFVGHYGLRGTDPKRWAPNVACVDYGVAEMDKGGFLCAYRWEGEAVLDDSHFVRCPGTAPTT